MALFSSSSSSSSEHATVKAWMRRQVAGGGFREELTDEPQYTQLAEAAAEHFDRHPWLDDETHPIWDWAIEAYDTSTRTLTRSR